MYLSSPGYFSRLGLYLCSDEITWLYLNKTINLLKLYPPASGSMQPENIPSYCAPCVCSELTTDATTVSTNMTLGDPVDQFISTLLTSVMINVSGIHKFCLRTVPILTGFLTDE